MGIINVLIIVKKQMENIYIHQHKLIFVKNVHSTNIKKQLILNHLNVLTYAKKDM